MKRMNMNLTVKGLGKKIDNGEFLFENEVQRACVWDKDRKSLLIDTLLQGYPIPPIFTTKGENGCFDVLDGKQRCTTLYNFINDGFELSEETAVIWNGEKVDIGGLKFSQLYDDMKDEILDNSLLVYYFEDITEEQTIELFRRLNNGKAMSNNDLNWSYCGQRPIALELGNHGLFTVMYGAKALDNKNHIPVVYKMYDMLTSGYEGANYSAKAMRELMKNAEITPNEKDNLVELFDILLMILGRVEDLNRDAYKKAKREINLLSLVPIVLSEYDNMLDGDGSFDYETIGDFYKEFLQNPTAEYIEASSNGTAKNSNIVARCEAMGESWEAYKQEHNTNIAERVEFDF